MGPVEGVDLSVGVLGEGDFAELLVDAGDGFAEGDGEFTVRDGSDEFEILG